MKVEEVVGWQVRERREALGLTQEQLGKRLEPFLGRAWSRQAVSAAEKGDRSFGAAELVALAAVLGVSPADLLRLPVQETAVDLGGPEAVRKNFLHEMLTVRAPGDPDPFAGIRDTLTRLADSAARNQEESARTLRLAQELDRQFNDEQLTHPVFTDTPPVVAVIVTSDRGVLVGRRNDGKPPWTFIAGEVEPGEGLEDAGVREVKEEATLEVRAGDVIGERYHPRTGRLMYYLAASPAHGTDVFVGDEAELAEVKWATLSEALELMPDMYERVREYLERELGEG